MNFEYTLDMICSRMERTNRRLFIVVLILIVSLILSNAGWLWYESQFKVTETTKIEAEQEASDNGNNYIIGGDYGNEAKGNNR